MILRMSYTKVYGLVIRLQDMESELSENQNTIVFDFQNAKFIKPWIYLIIANWIIEKKSAGYTFLFETVNVLNNSVLNYASRINFFNIIGYKYNEDFFRNNSKGKFIPLNTITTDNVSLIPSEITKIFINLCNLSINDNNPKDYNIAYMLEYSLTEVMENIDRHSEAKNGGMFIVQPYKSSKEIDICIIDSGIGIPKALRKTDKYKNLSDKECVCISTNKNVKTEGTENEGQGNGLYILKEFIKNTSGELRIISGGGVYILNADIEKSCDLGCNWTGTIVQFSYNYDQLISIKSIMGNDYDTYSPLLDDRVDLSNKIDEYLNF